MSLPTHLHFRDDDGEEEYFARLVTVRTLRLYVQGSGRVSRPTSSSEWSFMCGTVFRAKWRPPFQRNERYFYFISCILKTLSISSIFLAHLKPLKITFEVRKVIAIARWQPICTGLGTVHHGVRVKIVSSKLCFYRCWNMPFRLNPHLGVLGWFFSFERFLEGTGSYDRTLTYTLSVCLRMFEPSETSGDLLPSFSVLWFTRHPAMF